MMMMNKKRPFLTFIALVICTGVAFAAKGCPSICVCKWRKGKQFVSCREKNQITIPEAIDGETQVLDLSGNNLQILPREIFARHGLVNLQRLHLADCKIGQIDPAAFRGLTNLVELDLRGNLLTTVPTATFSDIPYLRDLRLSRNPLQKIESNAFEMIPQLVTLDLAHCGIRRVAAKAFSNLAQLEKLKLNGNNLREIRPKTIDSLRGLHGIELAANPWTCDCRLRPLKRLLLSDRVPLAEEPRCQEPPRLKGKAFNQLDVEEFACPPKVISMPKYVEASAGQNASILCRVKSVPKALIRWYEKRPSTSFSPREILNNSLINRGQQSFLIFQTHDGKADETSSQLVLTRVRVEDSGEFSCVAENPAGEIQANFSLQVGFFVGGVASLESGEIAGIAVAFAFVAIVLSFLILAFVAKRKFFHSNNANSASAATMIPVSVDRKPDLQHHQQRTATVTAALTSHDDVDDDDEDEDEKEEKNKAERDDTIVINGARYQMPKDGNNFPHLYTNRLSADALYPPPVPHSSTVAGQDQYFMQSHNNKDTSPIVTHRDLLNRFNGTAPAAAAAAAARGGFYSPQTHHRPLPVAAEEQHHYANLHSTAAATSARTLPRFAAAGQTIQYPSDFGLPKYSAEVEMYGNVIRNPLHEAQIDVLKRTWGPLREADEEDLDDGEEQDSKIVQQPDGIIGAAQNSQRESPDEGIQDDCSTDV